MLHLCQGVWIYVRNFYLRSGIRRLKLCLLPLKKANLSPHQHQLTPRDLDVLSAALLTQMLVDCALNSTSAAPTCSPRHKVRSEWSGAMILQRCHGTGNRTFLFVLTELTKLKMQLEVPGSTGTITSAADRKLEEGQRVSIAVPLTGAPLFLHLQWVWHCLCSCLFNRTCGSCAWTCRGSGWTCSLGNEPAVATREASVCARH